MFFVETVTTQGNHHCLIPHVNCQLLLESSRPLGKPAGESRLELPLLSLDILAGMQQSLGQGNAWTTFSFLAREGVWHWVHLPLTSCGLLQCSGLWVEASTAFSPSMRIASGGTGRCSQKKWLPDVDGNISWEFPGRCNVVAAVQHLHRAH